MVISKRSPVPRVNLRCGNQIVQQIEVLSMVNLNKSDALDIALMVFYNSVYYTIVCSCLKNMVRKRLIGEKNGIENVPLTIF